MSDTPFEKTAPPPPPDTDTPSQTWPSSAVTMLIGKAFFLLTPILMVIGVALSKRWGVVWPDNYLDEFRELVILLGTGYFVHRQEKKRIAETVQRVQTSERLRQQ